jgi:hypothetical protein
MFESDRVRGAKNKVFVIDVERAIAQGWGGGKKIKLIALDIPTSTITAL